MAPATGASLKAICPLCGGSDSEWSWLDRVFYLGHEYRYRECRTCGSLFCDPMPSDQVLSHMYGAGYQTAFDDAAQVTVDPKQPEIVLQWLQSSRRGVFVDYGCGAGKLIRQARELGWESIGVEFDPKVATAVAAATGCRVLTPDEASQRTIQADLLHIGDVIEHLTRIESQMPAVVDLLRPGGIILAQGPLEANANLFYGAIKLARRLSRRIKHAETAPYHVLLATRRGQRALFERFGTRELEFRMSEVSWPAPERLTGRQWAQPRLLVLYLLRKLSRALSRLQPQRLGNRYFYVGQK